MLFGAMIRKWGETSNLDRIAATLTNEGLAPELVFRAGPILLANIPPGLFGATGATPSQIFTGRQAGIWQGVIYNYEEMTSLSSTGRAERAEDSMDGHLFMRLYPDHGLSIVRRLNGGFVFAIVDELGNEITLGRDHLGLETLFVYEDGDQFIFSSKIAPIFRYSTVQPEINYDALRRCLIFNYNPAWDTFFRGIRKVKPGSLMRLGSSGIEEQPYWDLSFGDDLPRTEADIANELRELFDDAVRIRMRKCDAPGVFISGGLDSSGVACLMRRASDHPISSFSYRTLHRSFDESAYARMVADYCQLDHHEVIYRPQDVELIEQVVRLEDEPFCNLGITIASFLLGRETQGWSNCVFTGHGGDELFAGHPVYSADKIAAVTDRLPSALISTGAGLFRRLPDSDKKLNLTVKLKRFSESLAYPREFGTFRWRIYYGKDELNRLLAPHLWVDDEHYRSLFQDILEMYQVADGPDALSRSLYVDFKTEASFHLRRMDLVRRFDVRPVFPMLDYRLVERAASIPSSYKLRGYSDAKHIEKPVLAGIIPDQILHRRDKLGHSIPFKNWLRTDPSVKTFVQDTLSEEKLGKRAIFNTDTIKQMWETHQRAHQNNSHRLWMLAVLELWMDANCV